MRSVAATMAALTSVALLAGNNINTKLSVGVLVPSDIAFYRWLIALIVLLPFVAIRVWRSRREAQKHLLKMAVLGFLGMVLYQSLAYNAAHSTSAINMAAIAASTPVISIFLARWFASEALTLSKVSGGCIALVGVLLITSQGNLTTLFSSGIHKGDALMFIAAAAYALYNVLLRRWRIDLPMWDRLFWQLLFANAMLFSLWLLKPSHGATWHAIPIVLYAGLAASLIAPACWLFSVTVLGASRSTVFANLGPIFVAALAYSILGEPIYQYHLLGGVVILCGVLLGAWRREAKAENIAE